MNKTKYFCTSFDRHYFSRALALYGSLLKHCGDFHLFALCLDEDSYTNMAKLALPQVTIIFLGDLEKANSDLLNIKNTRSKVEYYWTCGPVYILFILENYAQVDIIAYLDADMFFFSDPESLYEEFGGYSVAIVEHRFSFLRQRKEKKFGIYNVGVLIFRRDEYAMACLSWWRDRCIEWCYSISSEGRYGDQKYLDSWQNKFKNVKVIQHKGVNLAPWNIAKYKITERDNRLWIDEQLLVCYHFAGLKELWPWLFDINLGRSGVRLSGKIKKRIFGFYINELQNLDIYSCGAKSLKKYNWQLNGFLRVVKILGDTFLKLVLGSYVIASRKEK
ncbi:MAG: glycosyl transferase [Gammaproteobacteria bacterium]|nr:glycosyl transferase [Gammaproteobacteria bacterium]